MHRQDAENGNGHKGKTDLLVDPLFELRVVHERGLVPELGADGARARGRRRLALEPAPEPRFGWLDA